MDIKNSIKKLNNPQFGSFGEFIFKHYVVEKLNHELIKVHKDGIDFKLNGKKIDVGSSRRFNRKDKNKTIKNKDAYVLFYDEKCNIIIPNYFDVELSWKKIELQFKRWSDGHVIKTSKSNAISYKNDYNKIKKKVIIFFNDKGFKTKIIYRTVSEKFGLRESPGNLYPKKIKDKFINIYIDFKNHVRKEENINFIIAFPDSGIKSIPLQKNISVRSGKKEIKKIDLISIEKTKHKCYFKNIHHLETQFLKRYKNI
jgi:hypothetical protein